MASPVVAAEAAANELLCIGEPQSTVVSSTAYARLTYSLYASHAPSSGLVLAYPVREAVERPHCGSHFDPIGSPWRCGLVAEVGALITGTVAMEAVGTVMLAQVCTSSQPPTTASAPGMMETD